MTPNTIIGEKTGFVFIVFFHKENRRFSTPVRINFNNNTRFVCCFNSYFVVEDEKSVYKILLSL